MDSRVLNEILRYDPESGYLYWRHRDRRYFKRDQDHLAWNKKFAGQRAFCTMLSNGYYTSRLFGKTTYAHRVIMVMVYGYEPDQVDHINGNRADNRLSNLRPVTRVQNAKNVARRSDNSSGHVGVSWHKKAQKWSAQVCLNGQRQHLGLFVSKDDAITARLKASEIRGFHPNHGREALVVY